MTRIASLTSPKCRSASMALAMDTHTYRLLYAVDLLLRWPYYRIYRDLETLAQFTSTFSIYLCPIYLPNLGSGRYFFFFFGYFELCTLFVGGVGGWLVTLDRAVKRSISNNKIAIEITHTLVQRSKKLPLLVWRRKITALTHCFFSGLSSSL